MKMKATLNYIKGKAMYILLVLMAVFCVWIYLSNAPEKEPEQITHSAYSEYGMYTKNYIMSYGYKIQTPEETDEENTHINGITHALVSDEFTGYYKVVSYEGFDDGTKESKLNKIVIVAYLDNLDPDLKYVCVDGEAVEVCDGKIIFSRIINLDEHIHTDLTIV